MQPTKELFPSNYVTAAKCPHCGEPMFLVHLVKSVRADLGSTSEVRSFECSNCDRPTITVLPE